MVSWLLQPLAGTGGGHPRPGRTRRAVFPARPSLLLWELLKGSSVCGQEGLLLLPLPPKWEPQGRGR